MYPSIALIIFIFFAIHIFRYIDRRRAIARRRWEAIYGPPRIFISANAPKPEMHDVLLYQKGRALDAKDWEEIQPLSTTIVHTQPIDPIRAPKGKVQKAPVSQRAKLLLRAIVKALGEEFSYLVFWRRQPSRLPDVSTLPGPPDPELVYTQHELVMSVVIAMPFERSVKAGEAGDAEPVPDVMLGFKEQGWV